MQNDRDIFPQLEGVAPELQAILSALCRASQTLEAKLRTPFRTAECEPALGVNTDGDQQVPLDLIADRLFYDALIDRSVKWYVSEEREGASLLDSQGGYALALDPLDGSSNVDVNIPVGTIFSIFPAMSKATDTYFRPVREQLAAGYFIYGPQLQLVLTVGGGVLQFIYDPQFATFVAMPERLTIAQDKKEFAINMSNYWHWPNPVRAFVDDCLNEHDGVSGGQFNMRWVASLVAEAHRIMTRGGVFLYPDDQRDGYEAGRLRMLYECAPIAFLIEQAGGMATNGQDPILSFTAGDFHQRVPFVFGSCDSVERVASFYKRPERELSALFGTRGLFRRK